MNGHATTRPAYKGDQRNLVISIDFGTTFSGASYAVLEPGVPPKIRSVTSYPGQEEVSNTKVPTVMYYDKQGNLRAFGAEANDPGRMDGSEDWFKLEWFKFKVKPSDARFLEADAPSPTLPPKKTIAAVLSDFYKYMNTCVREYIQKVDVEGQRLWDEVHERANYVLSHPNGWGGRQQAIMRDAAIAAGIVPDTDDGRSRIHFVSEGEASFHWCVESGLAAEALKVGTDIVVADCGGGTIDVSAYKVMQEEPLSLEETKVAECRVAGSVFVTKAFEKHVQEHLKGSEWDSPEIIDRLTNTFDSKSKELFKPGLVNVRVPFGLPRETNAALGIRGGNLTLSRDTMVEFFERSCVAVVDAIKLHIQGNQSTMVFLVGGFAASSYLLAEVERRLEEHNVSVKRAESQTAKAVADGAVGFYLDRYISARVAKYTYGFYGDRLYDPNNEEHVSRQHKVYLEGWTGNKLVVGGFHPLVIKGTAVQDTMESRFDLSIQAGSEGGAYEVAPTLVCYTGNKRDIRWTDEDINEFRDICKFTGRIDDDCLVLKTTKKGHVFYRINYTAVVKFGTTEFTCHVEWKNEEGTTVQGPTTAVWDEG